MGWWLLTRLGRAALAAWGIASLVFVLSRQLPTGPELATLEEAGNLSRPAAAMSAAAAPAAARQLRHRLGLDEPAFYITRSAARPGGWHWHGAHNQYHQWVMLLLHGNLGQSYRDGQPVASLLRQALGYSLPLAAGAATLATALALGLALYLARASGGKVRALIRAGLAGLQVMPLFLLALALLLLLANPDVLDLFPATGRISDTTAGSAGQLIGYWAARSALPLLSLILAVVPSLTLPLEAALRHEARMAYATTARAKGLGVGQVLRRHALPNAVLPLLTTLTDLLPALVAGTVVVEVVFSLPGSGRLLAEAAAAHDYPVVVAGVLLTAAARLLGLILADILYFTIDPRLRPTA
ncbi:ABC transporter permease [Hymenobacter sp. BRD67]|uniref:ABC transporter permease subunit n=1 Tax=Hymenobacter sp. BRD67 TaxID=2675877 RepID=UPI001566C67A|nr:ABC transporter permease [Hymenobacter sp. BRD67]QKG53646.1 ABC transporter permease [Hymenobacter sp. BRD67]